MFCPHASVHILHVESIICTCKEKNPPIPATLRYFAIKECFCRHCNRCEESLVAGSECIEQSKMKQSKYDLILLEPVKNYVFAPFLKEKVAVCKFVSTQSWR